MLAQPPGFITLLIASYYGVYMRIFGTNSSAGTYFPFRSFNLSGFHSLSRKRSTFRPSGLWATPGRRI